MKKLGVTLILVYIFWIFILIPFVCRNRVFSPLYAVNNRLNIQLEEYKNNARRSEAQKYLSSLNKNSHYHLREFRGESLSHLLIVISQPGTCEHKATLTQLITRLHIEIRSNLDQPTALLICNARDNSEEIRLLSQYFATINIANAKHVNVEERKKLHQQRCMQLAALQTFKYTTFIYDNVLPYEHFLYKTNYLITYRLDARLQYGELVEQPDWLFALLHEPITMRTFAWSVRTLKELLFIGLVGLALFGLLAKHVIGSPRKYLSWKHQFVFSFFGAVVLLTLALCHGREYLNELRRPVLRLLRVDEPDGLISLAAVTLSSKGLKHMIKYIQTVDCSPYVSLEDVWLHAMYTLGTPSFVISPSFVRYV